MDTAHQRASSDPEREALAQQIARLRVDGVPWDGPGGIVDAMHLVSSATQGRALLRRYGLDAASGGPVEIQPSYDRFEINPATGLRKGARNASLAAATPWRLSAGDTIKRVDLHAEYGGGGQGGIAPSARTANVLIFSDPRSGEQHGYFDGWHDDGLFHYTGEGQRGDQQMRAGNAAILNHAADGRSLRVFDGARGIVSYVDEFELADDEPYYLTDAPETDGGPIRQVIVFRLRPLTIVADTTSPIDPLLKQQVEIVSVEQQLTEKMWVAPSAEGHEAERREQTLVLAYQEHLLRRGFDAGRLKIVPPGEHKPLFTDLYSEKLALLVEAKGTVERNAIRMAIGQLADYRRFVDPGTTCAVLLPQAPRPDLAGLLEVEGIAAIWPAGDGFEDSRRGAFT